MSEQPEPSPQQSSFLEKVARARAERKAAARRRWRRLAAVLLLLPVLLAGGAAGAAYWLLATEAGLKFALDLPQRLETGVRVRAGSVKGSIWHGFHGQNWQIETESADIAVSRLAFDWRPSELWDKHLHIVKLAAGDVDIVSKPVPPKEEKKDKPKLPESLALPFTAAVDELSAGRITQDGTRLLGSAKLRYVYDRKAHRADIVRVESPWADGAGKLSLAADAPFALSGSLNAAGELDGIAVNSEVKLSGSLNDIKLETHLAGQGVGLDADTAVRPFADTLGKMVGHVNLRGHGINPQAFLNSLPQADLTFDAQVRPDLDNPQIGLDGRITLLNAKALPADKGGIPVRELQGGFGISQSGRVNVEEVTAVLLQRGAVTLSGHTDTAKQNLNLTVGLKNVRAEDLLAQDFDGALTGAVRVGGTYSQPQAAFDVDTGLAKLSGIAALLENPRLRQRSVRLQNGEILPRNGGRVRLSGSLDLFQKQNLNAVIHSENFNPKALYPTLPAARINGEVKLKGALADTAFHAEMRFAPSEIEGAVLAGGGTLSYENNHLSRADVNLNMGGNRLHAKGSFGKHGDSLNVDVDAPDLKPLGFGMQGLLAVKGSLKNTADSWTAVEADLTGRARGLRLPGDIRADSLDFRLRGSPDPERPLDVSATGAGIRTGDTLIDAVEAELRGSLRRHSLKASGSLKTDGKPLKLKLSADGGLNPQNQWLGTVNVLDVAGALNLHLNNPLALEAGAKRVSLGAARWRALGGSLNLERLVWDAQHGLNSKGSASGLHFSELHNFYTPPVQHDLVLSGDWDLSYSRSPRGYVRLRQQSGDIVLPTERKPKLGLNGLTATTDFTERGILTRFDGDTRYGRASGSFDILQAFGAGSFANAPVGGGVRLQVAELNNLRNLLPVGHTVKGSLNADIRFGGTLDAPKLQGGLNGSNLYYRNRDVGVALTNGTLQSHLQDRRWVIDALTFQHGDGRIVLSGSADYAADNPKVDAGIVFERYPILDMPNRRLVVSGKGRLGYDGKLFELDGKLTADEGRFGFQEGSMPVLDDDVVVVGEQKKEPSAATPLKLNLAFDLNDKFYFSGEGLKVTLGGKLTLRALPGESIQGVGSVNIVKGQYKAYGQDLVIKKGVISFVGPLDRPNLNIRAERRNSPVGAGVEVLGNLGSPRVSLTANQPMSEKDKLSWLILNRASSGSSTDEAALSTAAGAFLAGSLNDKLGLVDNFGLTSQQTRNAQTGEMNPAQQVLTFGKQLSQDLYLGYEAGLGNASQSVKLVYQLTRSFQAILRAGTQSSGGEIKYQKRFD